MSSSDEGRALGEAAAQAATDHADRVAPTWSTQAMDHLGAFLAGPGHDKPFMAEHIRAWAEKQGLEPPPDARAWGTILMRAARAGRIRRAGYGPSGNREAHGRPTTIWMRAA